MTKEKVSAYDILGLHASANQSQIKAAYHLKMKDFHPDKHNDSAPATELSKIIQLAYKILMDPASRLDHDYDLGIKQKPKENNYDDVKDFEPSDSLEIGLSIAAIAGTAVLALVIGFAIGRR